MPGGYAWWYVDAQSDDGRYGLAVIAFVGSVFSPYYAWSGRRDPLNHCALNVALYGRGVGRWAMTERGRRAVMRERDHFSVGPSALSWSDDALEIEVDEVCAPWPRRIRGRIRVLPEAIISQSIDLDREARHAWWPIAPRARVEVALDGPEINWSGRGYLDMNSGEVPLEESFRRWDWSRAHLRQGAALLYDVTEKDGQSQAYAIRVDSQGRLEPLEVGGRQSLRGTFWRILRTSRASPGQQVEIAATLEDTPFYARSLIATHLAGERVVAMHESLALGRFATTIVKLMLPFRMPRALW